MFDPQSSPDDAGPKQARKVVAIIAGKEVVELWHVFLERRDHRERDLNLPPEVETRFVSGRRERSIVYRRQLDRQEWGHFVIRRYQATRMLPWTPSLGLAMLIPGTLLAAGSANQGIMQVPLSLLVLQSALITIGGFLALGSGWRILTQRLRSADGVRLESLGVSSRALGFHDDVVAAEPAPPGYRTGRFIGLLQVEAPIGEWETLEEHTSEVGCR